GQGGAAHRGLPVGARSLQRGGGAQYVSGGEVVLPDVPCRQGRTVGEVGADDGLESGGFAHAGVPFIDQVGDAQDIQGAVDADVRGVGGQHAAGGRAQAVEELREPGGWVDRCRVGGEQLAAAQIGRGEMFGGYGEFQGGHAYGVVGVPVGGLAGVESFDGSLARRGDLRCGEL